MTFLMFGIIFLFAKNSPKIIKEFDISENGMKRTLEEHQLVKINSNLNHT